MKRLNYTWQQSRAVVLAVTIGVTVPVWTAVAQTVPPLESRWWPSIGDAAGSRLAMFGNVMQCTPGRCAQAMSLGADARIAGGLHVAAGARASGFDYGASYRWRHIGIAATAGEGTSLAQPAPPRMLQGIRNVIDTAGRVLSDTVFTPVEDSSTHDAVRWSSAEARLTWREDRWWITALLGRVAVARQGVSLWSGAQLGADIGRGASLLLGLGTTSRPIALAGLEPTRHSVSLGLGFNASILGPRRDVAPAKSPADSRAAFDVSSVAAGRIRITIRGPSAGSMSFASDCTGWQPIEMTQTRDGWVVEVAATRGLHHANIRLDGGRWVAPPGLASASDEFAGEVGIFVIE